MKRKDIPKATPRAFHPGGMVQPSYGPRPIPNVNTAMPGSPSANPYDGTPVQTGPLVDVAVAPIPTPSMPRRTPTPSTPSRTRRPPMLGRTPTQTPRAPRMPRQSPRGMPPFRRSPRTAGRRPLMSPLALFNRFGRSTTRRG